MGKSWNLDHDPEARPLGCTGKYGDAGRNRHRRRGEPPCADCNAATNHAARERRRGSPIGRPKKPCGTNAAARQHRLKQEPLCFPCKIAETEDHARRRKAAKEAVPTEAASVIQGEK